MKAEALYALPVGTHVGYGEGITARKTDDGWMVFEDDRPGLRVSSLQPARVTHVIEPSVSRPDDRIYLPGEDRPVRAADLNGSRTDELQRRLAEALPAKPPLGVIPRAIHEDRRLRELDRALLEYSAAGLPVDPAWAQERDDLLMAPGRTGLTIARLVRARQFGKAAEQAEVVADAIDALCKRALEAGCGVLLVKGDRATLGYVDARIPAGQLLEHPGDLPVVGGVEALLAGLYPAAGPRAGQGPPADAPRRSCGMVHPSSDVYHPEGH